MEKSETDVVSSDFDHAHPRGHAGGGPALAEASAPSGRERAGLPHRPVGAKRGYLALCPRQPVQTVGPAGPGPGGGVRRGGVFWPEPAGDAVSVAHRGADDLSVPVRLSGGRPAEGQLQRGREPGEKAVSLSPSPSCFYMKTDCRFYAGTS